MLTRKSLRRLVVGVVVALAVGMLVWHAITPPAVSTYAPHDKMLQRTDVYLFRARGTARALVWFYGNDVAFWRAHQELASKFAARGYDVIGFDVRHFFDATTVSGPVRDSLVAGTVAELLEHARHEFHDDSLPIVISGHSLGADCAAWTVAHVQIRNLAGLLMLSPTRRSHLYATVRDRAFLGEPTEPGSYAASEMIPLLPAGIPVVVMRGDNDSHNIGDRDLVRAIIMSGHATSVNMAYKKIPLAGHSLRSLVIVGPVIVSVLDNIVDLWYSSRHLSHP